MDWVEQVPDSEPESPAEASGPPTAGAALQEREAIVHPSLQIPQVHMPACQVLGPQECFLAA